jgi:hypothetical protein
MKSLNFTSGLIAISLLTAFAIGQAGVSAPALTPSLNPTGHGDKLLRALEGTWAITEKLAPDATAPNGSTGEGKIVWTTGPGGFSVIEKYESKRGAQEVTGLAVFWWDESAGGYRNIWCDSTNPGGCILFKNVAKWEGSRLVLLEDYEANGKKVTFKEVFGDITRNTFTQTLYGGESGGQLKVDQIIQARKVAPDTSRTDPIRRQKHF